VWMTADSTALCVNEGLPGDANRRRVVRGAVRVLLGPPRYLSFTLQLTPHIVVGPAGRWTCEGSPRATFHASSLNSPEIRTGVDDRWQHSPVCERGTTGGCQSTPRGAWGGSSLAGPTTNKWLNKAICWTSRTKQSCRSMS